MRKYITICDNKYLNYSCLLFIVTSLLIFIYCLNTSSFADFSKMVSALVLVQFAAFFSGSFLGFLFGFPSHNNNQFQEKYQRNSSLKEITSWLTKIIVGITLIEFKDIFTFLKSLISHLSMSLSNDSAHVVIITGIIGTYFILGFIVFFILAVTTIFEELVVNDKNIESILSDKVMNSNSLYIDNVHTYLNADFSSMDSGHKEQILKYISTHGIDKLNPLMTKRLGKFLFAMEEYDSSSKAYEIAYNKNNEDKYSLLNACYVKSKYLKDFDNSNSKLKQLIRTDPRFAPAYYNLACNYYREYLEFKDTPQNEYILNLKTKAEDYLETAFEFDKGLYSEAKKDSALNGIDIDKVFSKSKKDDDDKSVNDDDNAKTEGEGTPK